MDTTPRVYTIPHVASGDPATAAIIKWIKVLRGENVLWAKPRGLIMAWDFNEAVHRLIARYPKEFRCNCEKESLVGNG